MVTPLPASNVWYMLCNTTFVLCNRLHTCVIGLHMYTHVIHICVLHMSETIVDHTLLPGRVSGDTKMYLCRVSYSRCSGCSGATNSNGGRSTVRLGWVARRA